jgi:hypothetical protein
MAEDSASSGKGEEYISLNALRGQALQRLAGVHSRLEGRGVGAAFLRAAKIDPIGDVGFLGSLISNMILGGALGDWLDDYLHLDDYGLMDNFNGVAAVGLEGMSILRDLDSNGLRSRRMSDYPEGRRVYAMKEANMSRKFNLVSANQNNRFSFDTWADLACMFEILDMLDRLEAQDVKGINMDEKKPVYEVLKDLGKRKRGKDGIRNFPTKLRMAI